MLGWNAAIRKLHCNPVELLGECCVLRHGDRVGSLYAAAPLGLELEWQERDPLVDDDHQERYDAIGKRVRG